MKHRCLHGSLGDAWMIKNQNKTTTTPSTLLVQVNESALDEMLPGSAAPFLRAELPLIKAQPLGKQEPGLQ